MILLRFFTIFTVTKELNAFILSMDYKITSSDKVRLCFFFSCWCTQLSLSASKLRDRDITSKVGEFIGFLNLVHCIYCMHVIKVFMWRFWYIVAEWSYGSSLYKEKKWSPWRTWAHWSDYEQFRTFLDSENCDYLSVWDCSTFGVSFSYFFSPIDLVLSLTIVPCSAAFVFMMLIPSTTMYPSRYARLFSRFVVWKTNVRHDICIYTCSHWSWRIKIFLVKLIVLLLRWVSLIKGEVIEFHFCFLNVCVYTFYRLWLRETEVWVWILKMKMEVGWESLGALLY